MVAKDPNPNVRRKDLVEAAIRAGCAYYTARPQVQVALKKLKATALYLHSADKVTHPER